MSIDRDDPRLTAFALGELEGTDKADLEAALKDDPDALREIAAIEQFGALLGEKLGAVPCPELTAEQRDAITREAARPAAPAPILRPWFLRPAFHASAAAVALVALGLTFTAERRSGSLASREPAASPPAATKSLPVSTVPLYASPPYASPPHASPPRTPPADGAKTAEHGDDIEYAAKGEGLEQDARSVRERELRIAMAEAQARTKRDDDRLQDLLVAPDPQGPRTDSMGASPPPGPQPRRQPRRVSQGPTATNPPETKPEEMGPPTTPRAAPTPPPPPPAVRPPARPEPAAATGTPESAPTTPPSPDRGRAGYGGDTFGQPAPRAGAAGEDQGLVQRAFGGGTPEERELARVRRAQTEGEREKLLREQAGLGDLATADPADREPRVQLRSPPMTPPPPAGANVGEPGSGRRSMDIDRTHSGEGYAQVPENPFTSAEEAPLSTFSIDVDKASYSNVRRFLRQEGRLPPAAAVRIEELVNYFPYAYPQPTGEHPFATNVEVASCPWNTEHRLVRVGLRGKEVDDHVRVRSNLVFLVDVSGSMAPQNKLPLVKQSLTMLARQLTGTDRVAIVVYAGASGLVLDSTSCDHKDEVFAALERLNAGGSTNGGAGIQLAYEVARRNFVPGGVNRVVLCTDGDWNVGVRSRSELQALIEEKARSKVFLSVLGFGMGNLQDETLETLADKGNGNYGYVDTLAEARKLLVDELQGTLVTIAKDVKVQIEWNPARVSSYRLIGYENRVLAARDFADDKKDAGEIGAGHTVTALYEVVPTTPSTVRRDEEWAPSGKSRVVLKDGSVLVGTIRLAGAVVGVGTITGEVAVSMQDIVSITPIDAPAPGGLEGEAAAGPLMTLKLRYKQPEGDVSRLLEQPVSDSTQRFDAASTDLRFQAAVAGFGMLLRGSQHRGTTSFAMVDELASSSRGDDPQGLRAELVELVRTARRLAGQ